MRGRSQRHLLYFLIVSFFLITSFIAYSSSLEWDEGSFLQNAQYFSAETENFEESRPAAISYVISIVWSVTGESTFVARSLIILFGVLSVLVFYKIAEKEFDRPLLPTMFFAFSPLFLYWSSKVYTDVPGLLFVLMGMFLYRSRRFFLSGVSLSIASTIRYLYFIFAIGFAISFLMERKNKILEYISGGFTGSVPFMLYSYIGYGNLFSRVNMYLTRVSRWSNSGFLAATVPSVFSALYMLSSLIPAVVLSWKEALEIEKYSILTYSVFLILFSGNYFQRYWLPLVPIMLLMVYRSFEIKYFAIISSFMIVVSLTGVSSNYLIQEKCSVPLEQSLEYSSDLEGNIVSDSWAVSGYKLDNKVYSPYKSYQELVETQDVRYAIVSRRLNYTELASFSNECQTYYVYKLSRPSS